MLNTRKSRTGNEDIWGENEQKECTYNVLNNDLKNGTAAEWPIVIILSFENVIFIMRNNQT